MRKLLLLEGTLSHASGIVGGQVWLVHWQIAGTCKTRQVILGADTCGKFIPES